MFPINEVAAAFGVSMSALRYYDDIGLACATARRGRIRYYDTGALRRLAYAQLLLQEGRFGIKQTAIILDTPRAGRDELFAELLDEIGQRISGLEVARDMLRHIGECKEDDFNSCRLISTYLDNAVVDAMQTNRDAHDGRARFASWPRFRDGVHLLMDRGSQSRR